MINKKTSIISLLLVVFLSTACSSNVEDSKDVEVSEEKIEVKKETFDSELLEFNKIYKTALFATGKEKKEESKGASRQSYDKLRAIVAKYASAQPAEYKKTKDWVGSLRALETLEEEAVEMAFRGEFKESHEKLEVVRKKLMELRKENGIKNISDDMLVFHEIMEEVHEAELQADVLKHMQGLKLNFTVLKEYHQDNVKYKELIKDLENIIGGLESESESIYEESKIKLKPAFIALYIQFG